MADTFTPPQDPAQNSSKQTTTRIRRANFGDGYSLRVADGLNDIVRDVQLRWEGLSVTDYNTIIAFFEAHNGAEAFIYTLPDEGSSRTFSVENWTTTYPSGTLRGIVAQFNEEFDLI
tara:strand:+ start:4906 stop:5256 length:351 start_codon:yes stop_codon:yes gene_type:complete